MLVSPLEHHLVLLKALHKKIIRWKNYTKPRNAVLTKMLLTFMVVCNVTPPVLLRPLYPEGNDTIPCILIRNIDNHLPVINPTIVNFHDTKPCSRNQNINE